MKSRKTTVQFIQEVVNIHGYRYNYSKVHYTNNHTPVCIICKEHGEFLQTPSSHLNGADCPECAKIKRGIGIKKAKSKRDWDFEQPEDYKLIPLTQGKFAKVDNEDFDELKTVNWYYTSNGYIYNNTVGLIHRYIMKAPEGLDVDHIYHDKLDNRKCNLRLATKSQNVANSRPNLNGLSNYKGVYLVRYNNKWKAVIKKSKKVYNLGCFNTEEEAAKVYDAKAKELFGEFAYLNFKD